MRPTPSEAQQEAAAQGWPVPDTNSSIAWGEPSGGWIPLILQVCRRGTVGCTEAHTTSERDYLCYQSFEVSETLRTLRLKQLPFPKPRKKIRYPTLKISWKEKEL